MENFIIFKSESIEAVLTAQKTYLSLYSFDKAPSKSENINNIYLTVRFPKNYKHLSSDLNDKKLPAIERAEERTF